MTYFTTPLGYRLRIPAANPPKCMDYPTGFWLLIGILSELLELEYHPYSKTSSFLPFMLLPWCWDNYFIRLWATSPILSELKSIPSCCSPFLCTNNPSYCQLIISWDWSILQNSADTRYIQLPFSSKSSSWSSELVTPLHEFPFISRSITSSNNLMMQHAFAHQVKLHAQI